MKKHIFEIIACIWLTIVGVQFVATYFLGAKVDFIWAYGAMLIFLLVLGSLRLMRASTSGEKEPAPQPAGKQRRSRR